MQGGDVAGAYGMQYRFDFNQATTYANKDVYPPYTEFIEVEMKEDVYPYGMHIGCTRGCYATVSIKAKRGSQWVSVWQGRASNNEAVELQKRAEYFHFSMPEFCHVPFKTKKSFELV